MSLYPAHEPLMAQERGLRRARVKLSSVRYEVEEGSE
jgi:hypothetical protein